MSFTPSSERNFVRHHGGDVRSPSAATMARRRARFRAGEAGDGDDWDTRVALRLFV